MVGRKAQAVSVVSVSAVSEEADQADTWPAMVRQGHHGQPCPAMPSHARLLPRGSVFNPALLGNARDSFHCCKLPVVGASCPSIFSRRLQHIRIICGNVFQLARFDAPNQRWQVMETLGRRSQLPHAVIVGQVFCSALLDSQNPATFGEPQCLIAPVDKLTFDLVPTAQQFHDLVQALSQGQITPDHAMFQLEVEFVRHSWNNDLVLRCLNNKRLQCLKQHQTNIARSIQIKVSSKRWIGVPDGIIGIFGVEQI